MFSGNAKTHFQVIGKASDTGYMMSPFGDARWDIDDHEKLSKVFKKKNIYSTSSGSFQNVPNSHQQQPATIYKVNEVPHQEPVRQPHYGYVHQSGSVQGYMPKSETVCNYSSAEVKPQHYNYYQNYASYPSQAQPQTYPSARESFANYNQEVLTYRTTADVRHCNGLNQEEIKKRTKTTYTQPTSVITRQPGLRTSHEAQSSIQTPTICENCKSQQNTRNSREYSSKNWRISPDIPVYIVGEASYKPFGPENATPNPFYPTTNCTEYTPLR